MAALTADRNTKKLLDDRSEAYPVAASTKIYAGALVALNASGYAVPAADTAGLQVVGVAQEQADNSAGLAGAISVDVEVGVFELTTSGGSVDDVGKPVWVTDDQTVSMTAANVFAGTIHRYVSATSVYVNVEPAAREAKGVTIRDPNRNELLKFTATASAVNELTVTNAATGNAPSLTATGGDAAVGITIDPKGAGGLQLGSADSKLGVFGTTTAVQQNHIADSAGDDAAAVNAILVVLETYGLVKSA